MREIASKLYGKNLSPPVIQALNSYSRPSPFSDVKLTERIDIGQYISAVTQLFLPPTAPSAPDRSASM